MKACSFACVPRVENMEIMSGNLIFFGVSCIAKKSDDHASAPSFLTHTERVFKTQKAGSFRPELNAQHTQKNGNAIIIPIRPFIASAHNVYNINKLLLCKCGFFRICIQIIGRILRICLLNGIDRVIVWLQSKWLRLNRPQRFQ